MTKYRKKSVIIEATQWFKNGDHPEDWDDETRDIINSGKLLYREGKVVRRFNRPDIAGKTRCDGCNVSFSNHGWIDTLVCPGDWIITRDGKEYYPRKPNVFNKFYELVEDNNGKTRSNKN